jgi:energy-coupling factor transporter transmembrane protein EcfT
MNFKTTPDKSVKIVTLVIGLLFLLSIIGLAGMYIAEKTIILPVVAVIILSAFVFAYVYRPISYTVTQDQLIINRAAGSVHIPRSSIKSVDVIHRNLVDGSMRTFGVGGLFGYYGRFSNAKFGTMSWYVRRMDHLVFINTNAEKILVSPDDVNGFVAALR